jgi:hypothetical protein
VHAAPQVEVAVVPQSARRPVEDEPAQDDAVARQKRLAALDEALHEADEVYERSPCQVANESDGELRKSLPWYFAAIDLIAGLCLLGAGLCVLGVIVCLAAATEEGPRHFGTAVQFGVLAVVLVVASGLQLLLIDIAKSLRILRQKR